MTRRTSIYLKRRKVKHDRQKACLLSERLLEVRRKKELLSKAAKAAADGMKGLSASLRSRAYTSTLAHQRLLESYKQRILSKKTRKQ